MSTLPGAEVRYVVVNLLTNAAVQVSRGTGLGINGQGDVAGGLFLPGDDEAKPFVYADGVGLRVLPGLNGIGRGINSNGQVAVFGWVPGTVGGTNAWRYTPGIGYESLGTLGEPGDIGDVPHGMNNLGQVVGSSDTVFEGRPWQEAFLYTDGIGMVNLGHLTNRFSTADAINDFGQITGHSGAYAFLYTKETGMVAIGQGSGFAINNRGVVAGRVDWDYPYEAVIFEGGETRHLGTLGGETWANGINDYNVVVGATYPVRSGFVWTEVEGIVRLDTLVEPGWFIYEVWAINNKGQIAGEANGAAVRFDPIPPRLSVHPGATNVIVSWSPAWPGLVLESTDDLSAPDWQPVETGRTSVVIVPASTPQRFFRLNLDGARGLCWGP